MIDMQHRTALITGASAGLGAEFARQLAGPNARLVLLARRADRLAAQAAALAGTGAEVETIVADLAEPETPAAVAAELAARGITVDVLINNAGSAGPDLLEDDGWPAQEAFLRLMMLSVGELCHRFVPAMRRRGYGRVLNVASVAGRIARPSGCSYGPAKAWVIALSEELALSLRGTGVHVCALCPGFTHTEFHDVAGMQAMKAGLPGFLWYGPDVVVREGLEAVERGRPIQISGRLYRLFDPFLQSVWTRGLLLRSGAVPARARR